MNAGTPAVIVVGIDGSPASTVAARWAAQEAERRRLPLEVIYGYTEPITGWQPGYMPDPGLTDALRTVGQQIVDECVRELKAAHPQLEISSAVRHADPREALVSASDHAALTVVGSRGLGRLSEVILGSVALHVSSHARSAVAVIPAATDITTAFGSGSILLGVDGSTYSEAAVAFAFDEAAVRGCELHVALVTDDAAVRGRGWSAAIMGPLCPADEEERAVLAEQLAGWSEKYPDVVVRRVVLHGRPEELASYGQHLPDENKASMVIVGSRGYGPVAGLFVTSISHSIITRATTPVVVVPHGCSR